MVFSILPLLVLAGIVLAIVLAVQHARGRTPAAPPTPAPAAAPTSVPAPAVPPEPPASTRPGLRADLHRWVAAGLLSDPQSRAILAHEAALAAPPAAPATAPAVRPRRVPAVAEALGYLGGILAGVGIVLLVGQYWADMATAARAALSAVAAIALFVAGAFVREESDPALARLRGFLWLASTAATALCAGVLVADGYGTDNPDTTVLAVSGAVAVQSGLLWWNRDRPLQQLAFLVATVVFAGAVAGQFDADAAIGVTVWVVGAVGLALGLRHVGTAPLLTQAAGAAALAVGGPFIVATGSDSLGWALAAVTATGILTLALLPSLVAAPGSRVAAAIIGGIAAFQCIPAALAWFAEDAGLATGLVVWGVGALGILVATRGILRPVPVAEALGSVALIAGAAITGAQFAGFAPLFGIATGIALIALGMLPGQVLLSVFGSLGLLINVPWAIGHYFPGEGRAPLLILVTGALIIGVAVVLARMGGRFRRELGGPRGRGAPPSGVAPLGV